MLNQLSCPASCPVKVSTAGLAYSAVRQGFAQGEDHAAHMKLPVEMTVNNAETFVAAVEKARPESLTLPKQPAAGSLGGEAAMAQALVTWAASDAAKSVAVPSTATPLDRDLLSLIALSLPYARSRLSV